MGRRGHRGHPEGGPGRRPPCALAKLARSPRRGAERSDSSRRGDAHAHAVQWTHRHEPPLASPQRGRRSSWHDDDDARLRRRTPAPQEQACSPRLRRLAGTRPDRRVGDAFPPCHRPRARELGVALRWSYGSAFGLMHGLLHRSLGEPWASAVFGGVLMTATATLFPLLGRTPPPWRWPADVVATSVGTHAAYVTAVAVVDDAVRSGDAEEGRDRPVWAMTQAPWNGILAARCRMAHPTTSISATTPILPRREERPSFYVEEPDIPEGMTCADWRRLRRLSPEPGLAVRFRKWQRRHRFRIAPP